MATGSDASPSVEQIEEAKKALAKYAAQIIVGWLLGEGPEVAMARAAGYQGA